MLGGVQFRPGDSFVFESGGGGGWGDPLARDPELVAADVRNEIVSREAAERDYGVVLSDDLALYEATTKSRRETAKISAAG